MTNDQLLSMSPAKIAAEYRRAYHAHHVLGIRQPEYLKRLRAAFMVQQEVKKLGV